MLLLGFEVFEMQIKVISEAPYQCSILYIQPLTDIQTFRASDRPFHLIKNINTSHHICA